MLAGRRRHGPNAQSLLAGHVSQAPENIGRLRPRFRRGLNTVVMRCLEKRAADRWQHAQDLLPELDLLLTPSSGGMLPTSANYTVSSGTEAALRRSHPARVLATYALASIGVLGVVWVVTRQLGLPTWVFFGAVALSPSPAGHAPHGATRAPARRGKTHQRLPRRPHRVRRFFTWQKALTGGGVGFAGLGVLTIAYMAMRLLGIGSVGT